MTDIERETEQIERENAKSLTQKAMEGDLPTKQAAVVALRMAGAPFEAIAEELNYSNATAARNAYERGLAASAADYRDREHQRLLANKRLESLLLGMWDKSHNSNHPDHIAATRTSLAIIDRILRLQGIDEPQQIVLASQTAEGIEQWVRRALAIAKPEGLAEEEDIIDAEVLPGDD